jgi:hypothetical protein
MLPVGDSRKRYETLIFVRFRDCQAPETTVAQSFTALLELAAQLHLS